MSKRQDAETALKTLEEHAPTMVKWVRDYISELERKVKR